MTASWWRIARRMTMQLSTTGSWQRSKNTGPLSYCQLPGNHAPATAPPQTLATLPVAFYLHSVWSRQLTARSGSHSNSLLPIMHQAASRGEPTKSRTRHHRCYCRYANTPSHIRSYSHIHAVSIQCRGCQPGLHLLVMTSLNVPLRTDFSF